MKTIKFDVMGQHWDLRILSRRKYHDKNCKDTLATAHTDKRRIDVKKSAVNLETLIHELVHAFTAEMCVHQAQLDADDMEEILAEMFAVRGEEIIKLAKHLEKECKA